MARILLPRLGAAGRALGAPGCKVRNYLANKTFRFPLFAFFLYEILNVTFSPKNLCAYL